MSSLGDKNTQINFQLKNTGSKMTPTWWKRVAYSKIYTVVAVSKLHLEGLIVSGWGVVFWCSPKYCIKDIKSHTRKIKISLDNKKKKLNYKNKVQSWFVYTIFQIKLRYYI